MVAHSHLSACPMHVASLFRRSFEKSGTYDGTTNRLRKPLKRACRIRTRMRTVHVCAQVTWVTLGILRKPPPRALPFPPFIHLLSFSPPVHRQHCLGHHDCSGLRYNANFCGIQFAQLQIRSANQAPPTTTPSSMFESYLSFEIKGSGSTKKSIWQKVQSH